MKNQFESFSLTRCGWRSAHALFTQAFCLRKKDSPLGFLLPQLWYWRAIPPTENYLWKGRISGIRHRDAHTQKRAPLCRQALIDLWRIDLPEKYKSCTIKSYNWKLLHPTANSVLPMTTGERNWRYGYLQAAHSELHYPSRRTAVQVCGR